MTSALRSRRRRATEQEIAEAAVALFESQGVQETSAEQIARSAEVSVRTLFRYFPRKEDAALVAHAELRAALRDAVDALDLTEHPFVRVRRAYARVLADFDEAGSKVSSILLRVHRLRNSEPLLVQAGLRVDAEHTAWLVDRLIEQAGIDALEARLFAESAGVLFRQTMQFWADHHGQPDAPTVLESLAVVSRAWPGIAGTMVEQAPTAGLD